MKKILIHTDEATFLCEPGDKEIVCKLYDEPYLSFSDISTTDVDDKVSVDEIVGRDKTIMYAGDELIFRDPT